MQSLSVISLSFVIIGWNPFKKFAYSNSSENHGIVVFNCRTVFSNSHDQNMSSFKLFRVYFFCCSFFLGCNQIQDQKLFSVCTTLVNKTNTQRQLNISEPCERYDKLEYFWKKKIGCECSDIRIYWFILYWYNRLHMKMFCSFP